MRMFNIELSFILVTGESDAAEGELLLFFTAASTLWNPTHLSSPVFITHFHLFVVSEMSFSIMRML